MNLRDIWRAMSRAFFVITTGAVLAMFIFCLIFHPDASFTLLDIAGILIVAIVSDLTFLVFYSRKELSKRSMLIRHIIHAPVVMGELLFFAHILDWVNIYSAVEVAVFALLVIGIYVAVVATSTYLDKITADKLSDSLKKRYHS